MLRLVDLQLRAQLQLLFLRGMSYLLLQPCAPGLCSSRNKPRAPGIPLDAAITLLLHGLNSTGWTWSFFVLGGATVSRDCPTLACTGLTILLLCILQLSYHPLGLLR